MSSFSEEVQASPRSTTKSSPEIRINKNVQMKSQRPKSRSLQPCTCDVEGCGKRFSKQSNLRAHLRVHNGTLPYSCVFDGCFKRFRWKSSLRPHIRVHLACGHVLPFDTASQWAKKIAMEELKNLDSRRLKTCLRLGIENMRQNCLSSRSKVQNSFIPVCLRGERENRNLLINEPQSFSFTSQFDSDDHKSSDQRANQNHALESIKDFNTFAEISTGLKACPSQVHALVLEEDGLMDTNVATFQFDTEGEHTRVLSLILDDFSDYNMTLQNPFSDSANECIDNIGNYYNQIGSIPLLFCHFENLEDAWYLPGVY